MTACTRCETALEDGDLRCAICALPVQHSSEPVAVARSRVLRCTSCGAAIAFSAEAQAPHCGFCGQAMQIEQPVDPIEEARLRVPFAVGRDEAAAALRGWLAKRGWFAPSTLRDEAVLESLTPLAWAAWRVNAEALVTWAADSDAGAHRAAWAPHAGETEMTFRDIIVPASRGLHHDECELLVPYYELARAVPVEAPPAQGDVASMIESFDAQRSAARGFVQRAIEAIARTRVEPCIPGRRFRNVHVACLLERQTTERIALPAWVLAYRFRGNPYRAIVHGQRRGIVFGTSPIDWAKVGKLAVSVLLACAAVVLAAMLLTGCGGDKHPIDAPQFGEKCVPDQPTFAPLTGRAAVQGTLNVHVDAGGLIKVDTTSDLLLALDLVQTDTALAVKATLCHIQVPDVPLAGQDMPIQFQVPDSTVASVGTVDGTATLNAPDTTCTEFHSAPLTLVLGARLDPATIQTAPLPAADDNGAFVACPPSADTKCSLAIGTGCACDQEGDTRPGATLIAHNVPALDLDQAYVTLRTTFSLDGQVWSTDQVRGIVNATLDTGVLACRLLDGTPCSLMNVKTVRTLNPMVTQQEGNPSTFRAVRVPTTTTCADIIAQEANLFPR